MSAFIVNNETISVLVEGFIQYGIDYHANNYKAPKGWIIDLAEVRNAIGQSLLDQNYKSVNYRYNEDVKTPKFEYVPVNIDEGTIYGCIKCYEYQACETNDYFESDIHESFKRLQNEMLERFIKNAGQKMPYGYGGHDMNE